VPPVAVDGGDNEYGLVVLCLLLTRLKFLMRASVLWLDVSERALSAGDGGDRSGRGYS
jgi:hypothetical protein